MTEREINELLSSHQLHRLRSNAWKLEVRIQESNNQFMRDTRNLTLINKRIDEIERKIKEERFAEYISTPCWRYRVR